MSKHIATDVRDASAEDERIKALVDQTLDWLRPRLIDSARDLRGAMTPAAFFQFELALFLLVRELGRLWMELLTQPSGRGWQQPATRRAVLRPRISTAR